MLTSRVRDTAEVFFTRLAEVRRRALLFNFDRTIARFPEAQGKLGPELTGLLQGIIDQTETRVVMITQGSARELNSQLELDPGPEIWGYCAIERLLPHGDLEVGPLDARGARALTAARIAVTSANLGSCLEENSGALALSWRSLSAPAARHARNLAFRAWSPIAALNSLVLTEFDDGMELRLPKHDTRDAVRAIVNELGENSVAALLDDDDSSEKGAFCALRPQDFAVLVCPELQRTSASFWIKSPEELMHFFSMWLLACRRIQ